MPSAAIRTANFAMCGMALVARDFFSWERNLGLGYAPLSEHILYKGKRTLQRSNAIQMGVR